MKPDSEDALEYASIDLLQSLGYDLIFAQMERISIRSCKQGRFLFAPIVLFQANEHVFSMRVRL